MHICQLRINRMTTLCWKLSCSLILLWICSVNFLVSFIIRHQRHQRRITRKYCEEEEVFTYDDFKLTPIIPSEKLQELNNKLSRQQYNNNSVVEVRRYRIGNTSKTTTYKYIHSTNVTAMMNATLDEKFKELVEPLLDLELVAKTIEDWSRPLPANYLTQPLIFVGPSGVGKGRLVASLLKDYSRFFKKVVTHTTRKPRPDEIERTIYHFTDPVTFQAMIANHSFIEHATVHNNMYGTTISSWKQVQFEGKIPIMEIDIQGARAIKKVASKYGIRPKYLFVRPPDVDKLRERLMLRYV